MSRSVKRKAEQGLDQKFELDAQRQAYIQTGHYAKLVLLTADAGTARGCLRLFSRASAHHDDATSQLDAAAFESEWPCQWFVFVIQDTFIEILWACRPYEMVLPFLLPGASAVVLGAPMSSPLAFGLHALCSTTLPCTVMQLTTDGTLASAPPTLDKVWQQSFPHLVAAPMHAVLDFVQHLDCHPPVLGVDQAALNAVPPLVQQHLNHTMHTGDVPSLDAITAACSPSQSKQVVLEIVQHMHASGRIFIHHDVVLDMAWIVRAVWQLAVSDAACDGFVRRDHWKSFWPGTEYTDVQRHALWSLLQTHGVLCGAARSPSQPMIVPALLPDVAQELCAPSQSTGGAVCMRFDRIVLPPPFMPWLLSTLSTWDVHIVAQWKRGIAFTMNTEEDCHTQLQIQIQIQIQPLQQRICVTASGNWPWRVLGITLQCVYALFRACNVPAVAWYECCCMNGHPVPQNAEATDEYRCRACTSPTVLHVTALRHAMLRQSVSKRMLGVMERMARTETPVPWQDVWDAAPTNQPTMALPLQRLQATSEDVWVIGTLCCGHTPHIVVDADRVLRPDQLQLRWTQSGWWQAIVWEWLARQDAGVDVDVCSMLSVDNVKHLKLSNKTCADLHVQCLTLLDIMVPMHAAHNTLELELGIKLGTSAVRHVLRQRSNSNPVMCCSDHVVLSHNMCTIQRDGLQLLKTLLHQPAMFLDLQGAQCACEACGGVREHNTPTGGWVRYPTVRHDVQELTIQRVLHEDVHDGRTWLRAFHGTRFQDVLEILTYGLSPHGAKRLDDKVIAASSTSAQTQTPRMFFSPSKRYASLYCNAKSKLQRDAPGTTRMVMLECLVRARSRILGEDTIGASALGVMLDPEISNIDIEWGIENPKHVLITAVWMWSGSCHPYQSLVDSITRQRQRQQQQATYLP